MRNCSRSSGNTSPHRACRWVKGKFVLERGRRAWRRRLATRRQGGAWRACYEARRVGSALRVGAWRRTSGARSGGGARVRTSKRKARRARRRRAGAARWQKWWCRRVVNVLTCGRRSNYCWPLSSRWHEASVLWASGKQREGTRGVIPFNHSERQCRHFLLHRRSECKSIA